MMSRTIQRFLVTIVVGTVVAALVEAQDGWRAGTNDPAAPVAASRPPSQGNGSSLAENLQSIGRSLVAEYRAPSGGAAPSAVLGAPIGAAASAPPPTLLAADLGGLHSVLKRKRIRDSAPSPGGSTTSSPPAVSDTASTADGESTAETEAPAAGTTPGAAEPVEIQASPPPTASVSRSPSDGTSSRRSRSLPVLSARPAGTPPLAIKARPISTRRVEKTGTSASGSASSAILARSVGALVRVDTIGPDTIILGEPTRYVVRVANQGKTEARQIQVRIALPDTVRLDGTDASEGTTHAEQGPKGTRILIWSVDRLAPMAERPLTLNLVPLANRPFELAVQWSLEPIAASARITVQQPMLEIALSGPSEIVYGEVRAYTIVVTNPGTGDAKNVSVDVAMGNAVADTLSVGTIPAGGSRRLDVEVTARQAGALQIAATANGENGLRAQAVQQVVVQRARLEIEAAGPSLKFTDSVGTYQVRVANVGDAQARRVQAIVYLPTGVKYLRGLDGATESDDAVSWQVGDLAPGTERVYRFSCDMKTEGNALFRFAAREATGLQAACDVTTRVDAVADLKLEVNDPKGPIPVAEETIYEIKITNRGSKAATGVQVVAQFSEGIEPVGAQGAPAELVPGQVVFQPILRIAPQETVLLSVKAKAEAGGNHVFRAEVKCNDPETHLVAEDTTRYFTEDDTEFPTNRSIALPPRGAGLQSPRIGARPVRGDTTEP